MHPASAVVPMPRNAKGIGRTGKKHKRVADHDLSRQPKSQEGISGPLFTPVLQDSINKIDEKAPESSSDEREEHSDSDVDEDADDAGPPRHPRYSSGEPLHPEHRPLIPGSWAEWMWDPDQPPCVPSDERPDKLFGSEEAARATALAHNLMSTRENIIELQNGMEKESIWDEEQLLEAEAAVLQVHYKHAVRILAEAFPELELSVAEVCAGIHASEQPTRPCPCGGGKLARWPWMLQTVDLGFCPNARSGAPSPDGSGAPFCQKHGKEIIMWVYEWVRAWDPDHERRGVGVQPHCLPPMVPRT